MTAFQAVNRYFEEAARLIDLDEEMHSVLTTTYREILARDVNTNAQTMAWMMDAFSASHGYSPAIVTGKPLSLGGQPGREAATGRGVIYVLAAYAERHGIDLNGLRIAIQGFGNV